jgi:hypothetical protein
MGNLRVLRMHMMMIARSGMARGNNPTALNRLIDEPLICSTVVI